MALSEARKRANRKYQQANREMISVEVQKGVKAIWKSAAERKGKSLNKYIQESVAQRMERDAPAEADALMALIHAVTEAHIRPYTVTFRTSEVTLPTNTVKSSGRDAQKVVEASSEAEARVMFFGWLKEQMQTEVAFEDATRLGIKRDDGVVEICEIVSVE